MAHDIRKERVGVAHAARLLDVSVGELKEAIRQEAPLRGHPPPRPIMRTAGPNNNEMLFLLGDVLDTAEALGSRYV